MPIYSQAEAFAKRPGMYIGRPIRIDRVMIFLHGYEVAIFHVRLARFPEIAKVHQSAVHCHSSALRCGMKDGCDGTAWSSLRWPKQSAGQVKNRPC